MIWLIIILSGALLVAAIFLFLMGNHITDLSEEVTDLKRQKELLLNQIHKQSIEISALSGTKIVSQTLY